jgi:hypothetical protein
MLALLGKLVEGQSTKENSAVSTRVIQAQKAAWSDKELEEEMKFRRMLREGMRNLRVEEQRITEFKSTTAENELPH